jgi:Protein of unknown function (DUF2845)
MLPRTLLACICLSVPALGFCDAMRCGKWIVNETTPPAELLKKCGEPQSKDVVEEDVLGLNAAGRPIKLGVQVKERWLYQRSPGALPMLVTIVGGQTKSLARAE